MPTGCHINLLVCSGALANFAPGDEALGLIPALLYSGAASTVSTLWLTRDADAAAFGRAFFRELGAECKRLGFGQDPEAERGSELDVNEEGKWINLAKVVQRAVVSLDDESQTVPLMNWAGFVLHGFWTVWVGNKDGRMFCQTVRGMEILTQEQ
jgi:hypothetical protein